MRLKIFIAVIVFSLSVSLTIAQEYHTVTRVIDGDTFEIENGETVRLIGVDTPETVHPSKPVEYYGKEASDFTKKTIEGRTVRLEFDEERRDRYGRVLAYAWIKNSSGDEVLINRSMVLYGFGNIMFYLPNGKYFSELIDGLKIAREAKIGIWDFDKRVEALGEEQAKSSLSELRDKISENVTSYTDWLESETDRRRSERDERHNDFIESSKEEKRIREIVFDNEKLSIYIDDSFYDLSMHAKKLMFDYVQIYYENVSGINNLKIFIYDNEELIGSYDDNGLIFIK